MESLKGLLILTKTLISILSQPLQTVLFLVGSMKFQLFSVIILGVYVRSPTQSDSEYFMYYLGSKLSLRFIERPLIIIESTILQLYSIYSAKFRFFYTLIYKFCLFASSIDLRTFLVRPYSQYSFIYYQFLSAIAYMDALYIFNKQSVTLADGILQYDMTLFDKYENFGQYLSFVPHNLMGNFILLSICS